ncbi:MAG: MBL fold metallo-hydrolase [Saccharofermentanales bacterium]
MSKKATEFQVKMMSRIYRGKGIFKPLNTGWIDEHVASVREYIANIYFYTKGSTTIMLDAGYSYPRLAEKMRWLDLDPADISTIFITHQDTDHVGAVEADSEGLFRHATLYIGEIENRYLTGKVRRKVSYGTYKLPPVSIPNDKVLLHDGQRVQIDDILVECFLVPGHTWGHMVYLVDDTYLFTGDTIWFGADGGYSFINTLAESNQLAKASLQTLKHTLEERNLQPLVITGHTGWSDDFEFVFRHTDHVCNAFKKATPMDPDAPYDGYDEHDDTEEKARHGFLPKAHDLCSKG